MIQDRRHKAHDVSEAMFSDRNKRNNERKCPRKYCDLEYKAIESHPED